MYYLGLDLGRRRDHTAIAVLEKRERAYRTAGPALQLRHVERVPLGTTYQEVVERVREVVSGVKAGERVVVDGIQRVRGGVTVEPRLAEMPVFHDPRLAPAAPEVPKPAGKS